MYREHGLSCLLCGTFDRALSVGVVSTLPPGFLVLLAHRTLQSLT